VARIAVEFVREPDVQLGYLAGGWFTMGQLLSLPMLLTGIVLMLVAYQRETPSGNFSPVA
jgi:phosphatidylglycerol:prolipoprotein diacylglycerol transferase